MCALGSALLSAARYTFQSVLTNCIQQHKTRFCAWMLNLLNEAFINKRCHAFEDIKSEILFGVADRFDSFQSAATDEGRNSSEQRLLGLAEKFVAPVDCSSQRLLSQRQIFGSARKQLQAALQSCLHCRRRQQLDAGSG